MTRTFPTRFYVSKYKEERGNKRAMGNNLIANGWKPKGCEDTADRWKLEGYKDSADGC